MLRCNVVLRHLTQFGWTSSYVDYIYLKFLGCSKYSVRTASVKTEATHSLIHTQSPNRTDFFLFNQNVVVNHDGKPTFGAKIIFWEYDNNQGSRYEIGSFT